MSKFYFLIIVSVFFLGMVYFEQAHAYDEKSSSDAAPYRKANRWKLQCDTRLVPAFSDPTIIELDVSGCRIDPQQLMNLLSRSEIPSDVREVSISLPRSRDFTLIANQALEQACRVAGGKSINTRTYGEAIRRQQFIKQIERSISKNKHVFYFNSVDNFYPSKSRNSKSCNMEMKILPTIWLSSGRDPSNKPH